MRPTSPSSVSTPTSASTPHDAFLKFLKRIGLAEYADWFMCPQIGFETEASMRAGFAMMQSKPEMLTHIAKAYPLPSDLSIEYLHKRIIATHSFAVLVASPEGTRKRDDALATDLANLHRLFVTSSIFSYDPDDVFCITAKTANDIRTALRRIACLTDINEAINFVFYYSGHGVGQALLCQDGSQVRGADLAKLLGDIRAKSKLAILDCCFAGSMVDPVVSPSRDRSDSVSLQMDIQSRGMAVLGSSNREQTSAWFNGFTSLLLCALEGAPICPLTNSPQCGANDQCSFFRTKVSQIEQGYICIFDLFQFLKKHANQLTVDGLHFVHPYLKYEGEDNFRICKFAGRPVERDELDNFLSRAMSNDGDADMQKYFLRKLNELGTQMDSALRTAIDEGDAHLKHTLLEAITSSTEQVKQSLLKAISEGDSQVRTSAIEHVEKAVEHVVESQILAHAPNLVNDAVANTIHTTMNILRSKYKHDDTIRLLPHVPDSTISIDAIFTTLNILSQDEVIRPPQVLESRQQTLQKFDDVFQVRQHLSIDRLFSVHQDTHKKILIQGRPGIGKTTLCRRMAREWGLGSLWDGRFNAVFFIPLGSITEADTPLDLPHLIHKYCLDGSPVVSPSLLGQSLRQRAEKILIILDGFDEFPGAKHSPTLHAFIHGQVPEYNQCRVILTSRISSVNTLRHVLSERDSFDLEIEVVGYTDAASRRFIYSYFDAVDNQNLADGLVEALRHNPILQGIAHIPLHATLLCMMWEERGGIFPDTTTELVKHLVEDILDRNTRRLWVLRGEPAKNIKDILARMLVCLGQLAMYGFSTNALLFQASTVEEYCKNKLPTELGFLYEDKISSRRKGSRPVYYFLHLAFQEYLAAFYLVHTRTIIANFNADPRYDMIWRFACGIMGENAGPIIELVVAQARQTASARLLLLALDCIHESRNSAKFSSMIFRDLKGSVDLRNTDLSLSQLTRIISIADVAGIEQIYACSTCIGKPSPSTKAFVSALSQTKTLRSLWYVCAISELRLY